MAVTWVRSDLLCLLSHYSASLASCIRSVPEFRLWVWMTSSDTFSKWQILAVRDTCIWGPCCHSSLTFTLINTHKRKTLFSPSAVGILWGTWKVPNLCLVHSRCSINVHCFYHHLWLGKGSAFPNCPWSFFHVLFPDKKHLLWGRPSLHSWLSLSVFYNSVSSSFPSCVVHSLQLVQVPPFLKYLH